MIHVHSSLSRSVIARTDGNGGSLTSQAVHLAIRKTTKQTSSHVLHLPQPQL